MIKFTFFNRPFNILIINLLLCAILIFSTHNSLKAQNWVGGIAFTLGTPQGEFAQNSRFTGVGANMNIGYQLSTKIPFTIGLDLSYMNAGNVSKDEDLLSVISAGNIPIATLILPLNFTANNNIFGTHLFLRLEAPLKKVRPFAEFLIGARFFSTGVSIRDRSANRRFSNANTDVISTETVISESVLSYGFGGGLIIEVSENVDLNIRVDYFKGARAKYYNRDDIKSWTVNFIGSTTNISNSNINNTNFNDSDFDFEAALPKESTTDLLMFNVGVGFKF